MKTPEIFNLEFKKDQKHVGVVDLWSAYLLLLVSGVALSHMQQGQHIVRVRRVLIWRNSPLVRKSVFC